MEVGAVAAEIDAELRGLEADERAIKERAYLKSDVQHYGASVPAIRSVARAVADCYAALDHDQLVDLVAALWEVPVHERRMAAVELLDFYSDRLDSGDMPFLERLLRQARTWALVDPLAVSVVGGMMEARPAAVSTLDRWASDDDFWVRRAALLALLPALRRGEGDFERFGRYADAMLDEKEFFVRKAIGWVLRDTAKRRPDLVAAWLLPRASRASGVTLREAVKPLSDDQRQAVLAASRPAG